jgi:hypothetical protein|tara:strand:+ start:608 stop:1084 length:477 start_codon:yes stop_codon:yes gene_type:complete
MAYKQAPKSMALKALIGNQKNLPEALKAKILAVPESAAKQTRQGDAKLLMEPLATKEKKMMAVKSEIKKQQVKPKKKVTMQADSGKFKSEEQMRLEEAKYKNRQRKKNAQAAKIERKTVRQDLRAQKQERRAANMKKRLDRKEETKKTKVGKALKGKK